MQNVTLTKAIFTRARLNTKMLNYEYILTTSCKGQQYSYLKYN